MGDRRRGALGSGCGRTVRTSGTGVRRSFVTNTAVATAVRTGTGAVLRRAACAAGLTLWLIVSSGCSDSKPPDQVEFRVPVSVAEATIGVVEDRVVATGTLRAPEMATLAVETTGILRVARAGGRRLAEGDAVRRGQMVAEVAGEDVELAARSEATLRRLETAARDYEAKRALHEQGLITLLDLKAAESTLAEARNDQERSRLTEARTRLVAPLSGTIVSLARDQSGQPIADGQRVVVGTAIAQIAPLGKLIADIDLVGDDVARVSAGQPARVRQHAFEPRRFDAQVLRLAPALDPTTRALRAEVEIDNSEQLLRPGMFVEVTVVIQRHEQAVVAPRSAVTERAGKKVVFVLKEQAVEQRAVTLGLGDDEQVELTAGLKSGERIVVKGLETLADNSKVRIQN